MMPTRRCDFACLTRLISTSLLVLIKLNIGTNRETIQSRADESGTRDHEDYLETREFDGSRSLRGSSHTPKDSLHHSDDDDGNTRAKRTFAKIRTRARICLCTGGARNQSDQQHGSGVCKASIQWIPKAITHSSCRQSGPPSSWLDKRRGRSGVARNRARTTACSIPVSLPSRRRLQPLPH